MATEKTDSAAVEDLVLAIGRQRQLWRRLAKDDEILRLQARPGASR